MYTSQPRNSSSYGGLGDMWNERIDASSLIPKKPQDYKKSDVVWGSHALGWVQNLVNMEKARQQQSSIEKVFWTPQGPRYADRVWDGKRAEKVEEPKKIYKAAVDIVRDMPSLELPPIEIPEGGVIGAEKAVAKLQAETSSGLGENKPVNYLPWVVLSLIIIGFLYNKS